MNIKKSLKIYITTNYNNKTIKINKKLYYLLFIFKIILLFV